MQKSGYRASSKPITNSKEFEKQLDAAVEQIVVTVQEAFVKIAGKTVSFVINRPMSESWYDDSGNLRSSIGYVVARNDEVVKIGGFKQVLQGSEGVLKGREAALNLASQYPDTLVMIIVAGMDYADYVEAIESKDVLASAKGYVERQFEAYARKFNSKKRK